MKENSKDYEFCIRNNINVVSFGKSIKQYGTFFCIFVIIKFFITMSYEAGSKECRHLIEAKESLLSAMDALSNMNSTDLLQVQIKEIYNKLEQMHDKRKKIESATNYL